MTSSQSDPGEIPSAASTEMPGGDAVPPRTYRWYHKFFAVMLATGCLMVGAVLLVFPWTPSWEHNYFAGVTPFLRSCWNNFYLRGVVSGIGMVNLYISLVEVFRLKRFSQR
ncbi:MAG TPA: hypothetical protein VKF41_07315 [Bryobacteraceae bacterium]|nr:hypothetical protein [Bryobacteraceae bacterium]